MPSSAQKGARWKKRTKKWLIDRGWQVADLEVVRWIYSARGRMPVKRDQFGSDLLAMTDKAIVFVQVKGGLARNVGRARDEFAKYTFPPQCAQWVIYWKPRAREPEVIDVTG